MRFINDRDPDLWTHARDCGTPPSYSHPLIASNRALLVFILHSTVLTARANLYQILVLSIVFLEAKMSEYRSLFGDRNLIWSICDLRLYHSA